MLENSIINTRYKIGQAFEKLKTALNTGRFSMRKDISLIFLCGANVTVGASSTPSERRKFLKKNIEKQLPHARIIYAEKVMEELAKHGKTKNLLDIEHQITDIADWVLIVLESQSAFCELGAFAHTNFRDKLLIINDSQYKEQKSFINLGPIQAISDDVDPARISWYPMQVGGLTQLDGIGEVFPGIVDILKKNPRKRSRKNKLDKVAVKPSISSQASLLFLHDLIYLCGPLSHPETIIIYKQLFGEKESFDEIRHLRGGASCI